MIRTISKDPGLLTPEELLASHKGGRRRTLEEIIQQSKMDRLNQGRSSIVNFFHTFREHIRWFLDKAHIEISYDDVMTFVTVFVLFGDWIRTLSFPPSADSTFSFLYSVSFFLFLIEIILYCWAKSDFSGGLFNVKGYMFDFFFWLDLLCILSMIPDLGWAIGFSFPGSSVGGKAGKAGKIGAKAGRVVRMARLIRLVKLYKITSQRQREKKIIEDLAKLIDMGHIDESEIEAYMSKMKSPEKQSKVGAELSDIITRRVIVAVLLMLIVVPLLSYSSSTDNEFEATKFLQTINIQTNWNKSSPDCDYLRASASEFTTFMNTLFDDTNKNYEYLVGLKIEPDRCEVYNEINFSLDEVINSSRKDEIAEFESEKMNIDGHDYFVETKFNQKLFLQEEAYSGIYMTLFVVFMLVSLSTQFNGDAQKLVLAPIESMMTMVHMVADDPLVEYDFHAIAGKGEYETRVVQMAIQKITSLLRVGFGVAGAEIISTNMAIEGEGTSVLEPMIPGKRVYAIFGFCGINYFDLYTERLEDEIMTFVNHIARIVHDEVTMWGGMCNKNLGSSFLMVWRIGDEGALQEVTGRKRRKSQQQQQQQQQQNRSTFNSLTSISSQSVRALAVDLRRVPGLDILSDKAVIGFLKVIVGINRDKQLLVYRNDKRLTTEKNGSSVSTLRMGFGLHAGWAIEGAVGSLQKVDATYLSPHVNMAARMEAASKQFKVSLLLTEKVYELMSSEAQEHLRKIDVVTVKGSSVPMPIYTYETYQNQVFPQLRPPKFTDLNVIDILQRQADDYDSIIWKEDPDLVQLRCLSSPAFQEIFRQGLSYYLSGKWNKARESLENADKMIKMEQSQLLDQKNIIEGVQGDGPSQTLLAYMKARNWICPPDWKGYRPLTSK